MLTATGYIYILDATVRLTPISFNLHDALVLPLFKIDSLVTSSPIPSTSCQDRALRTSAENSDPVTCQFDISLRRRTVPPLRDFRRFAGQPGAYLKQR